jgi:hypothetical protein
MLSPPLSDFEISLAIAGDRRPRQWATLFYYPAIMRIFRTGLQKLPIRLKKILSSRYDVANF